LYYRKDTMTASDLLHGTESTGVTATDFRHALGSFASGVTVVTTMRPDGSPVGITVSAFNSLSVDPPLVLVCVARGAYSHPAFESCPRFAVSVLNGNQGELARRYATAGGDKFRDEDTESSPAGGLPVIRDALAWLECESYAVLPGGDHSILVGLVSSVAHRPGTPMVNYRGTLGLFSGGCGAKES
jgi:flavin reductase ActVB